MKDYLFNKPIPFITEGTENSKSKYIARGFASLFGNDQRNFLMFVLGFATPPIVLCFICLFIISWGHPILMIFDFLLLAFAIWVAWAICDICKRTNKTLSKY